MNVYSPSVLCLHNDQISQDVVIAKVHEKKIKGLIKLAACVVTKLKVDPNHMHSYCGCKMNDVVLVFSLCEGKLILRA